MGSVDVPFRNGELPEAPVGTALSSIGFRACEAPTVLTLVHVFDDKLDGGIVGGGMWEVIDKDSGATGRARYVCTHKGRESVAWLLNNYGFLDNDSCTNGRVGTLSFAEDAQVQNRRDAAAALFPPWCGVAQSPGHGWCWYSSLCTALFGNEALAAIVLAAAPAELRSLMKEALHDAEVAFELQEALFKTLQLGHDPRQAGHLDSGNAIDEYPKLLRHLGVTHEAILYNVSKGYPTTCGEGRLKPASRVLTIKVPSKASVRQPMHTNLKVLRKGEWHNYSLRAIVIGSHQCGHQVAVVRLDDEGSRWILIDADALMHGLRGPLIVFPDGAPAGDVWKAFENVAMSTYYGAGKQQVCALSPNADNATIGCIYLRE